MLLASTPTDSFSTAFTPFVLGLGFVETLTSSQSSSCSDSWAATPGKQTGVTTWFINRNEAGPGRPARGYARRSCRICCRSAIGTDRLVIAEEAVPILAGALRLPASSC